MAILVTMHGLNGQSLLSKHFLFCLLRILDLIYNRLSSLRGMTNLALAKNVKVSERLNGVQMGSRQLAKFKPRSFPLSENFSYSANIYSMARYFRIYFLNLANTLVAHQKNYRQTTLF